MYQFRRHFGMNSEYYNAYVNPETNAIDSGYQKNSIENEFWTTRSEIQDMVGRGMNDLLVAKATSQPHLCLHIQYELEMNLEQYKWAHPSAIKIIEAISEIHFLIIHNMSSAITKEFRKYRKFPNIIIELLRSVTSGFYSSTDFENVALNGTTYNSHMQAYQRFYAEHLISNGILKDELSIIGKYKSKAMLYLFMITVRHCKKHVSDERIKECFEDPKLVMTMQSILNNVETSRFKFIDQLNVDFANLMVVLFREGSNYNVYYETIICQSLLNQLGNDDFLDNDNIRSLLNLIYMNTQSGTLIDLQSSLKNFMLETDVGKHESKAVKNILLKCLYLDTGVHAYR
jgi:hypothetical protein